MGPEATVGEDRNGRSPVLGSGFQPQEWVADQPQTGSVSRFGVRHMGCPWPLVWSLTRGVGPRRRRVSELVQAQDGCSPSPKTAFQQVEGASRHGVVFRRRRIGVRALSVLRGGAMLL